MNLCCRFAVANNGDESIPPDQCGFSEGTSILLYQTTLVTRFFPALFSGESEQENQAVIQNTKDKASGVRKVKVSDKKKIFDRNGTSVLLYPTTLETRFFPALFTEDSEEENQVVTQNTKTKAKDKREAKISDENDHLAKANSAAKSGRCESKGFFARLLCGLQA